MKTFIAGLGEIGGSLSGILSDYYEVHGYDVKQGKIGKWPVGVNILHVCFPYSEKFTQQVREYQKNLKPKYTVIHSTVPVGTSASLDAIHSPVRGLHPYLKEGLLTFVKFLGGPNAEKVADYFRRAGMKVYICDKSETTELAKLLDTEYYRACIEFTRKSKQLCDALDIPFAETYTLFNQTYNEGYNKLNHPEYIRPTLLPIFGPIGGHCVVPNQKLMETLLQNLKKRGGKIDFTI
ncbi:MAG: hypothetical protein KGI73_04765 [Patescibacteria group bacterium]|nr:hypothetical protein [Patescibacteria group bacterium]